MNNDLKKIMRSHKELTREMSLPIFLGFDEDDQPLIVDLAKVGHILVGGDSAQGKTNLLHAFAQSVCHSPRKVYEGCFVTYISLRGVEGPHSYFDSYLTTVDESRRELEMLCEKIEKRMNDPKLSRYPIMILVDEFADLVISDSRFAELLVYIAQRGHRVGVYLVAASQHHVSTVFPGRLKVNILIRICFRVVDKYQSRLVLDTSDATLLSRQGEMLFRHNLKLTRLQTLNVIDNNGE